MLYAALLGGSILIGRPFLRPMFAQTVGALTREQRAELDPLLDEPPVARALKRGTLIVGATTVVLAAVNIAANIQIVTAAFGTETFNEQVAQVNLMTRLAYPVATMAAFGIAIWMIYRAVFMSVLPSASKQPWYEVDLWHVLRERNSRPAGD